MTLVDLPVGKGPSYRYIRAAWVSESVWTLRRKRKISYCKRDSNPGSTKLRRRNFEVMIREFLSCARDRTLREISAPPLGRNLEGRNSLSWTVSDERTLLQLTGTEPHSSDQTPVTNTLHSCLRRFLLTVHIRHNFVQQFTYLSRNIWEEN
jgi:hypothetical protein